MFLKKVLIKICSVKKCDFPAENWALLPNLTKKVHLSFQLQIELLCLKQGKHIYVSCYDCLTYTAFCTLHQRKSLISCLNTCSQMSERAYRVAWEQVVLKCLCHFTLHRNFQTEPWEFFSLEVLLKQFIIIGIGQVWNKIFYFVGINILKS